MELPEIIASLEDQAKDKEQFADHDDPEDIFAEDVTALREAAELLKRPALDRSRWTGCVYCDGQYCESCRYACYEMLKEPCATCKLGVDRYDPANYCPMCGRPRTEDAWAELGRRIGGTNNGP